MPCSPARGRALPCPRARWRPAADPGLDPSGGMGAAHGRAPEPSSRATRPVTATGNGITLTTTAVRAAAQRPQLHRQRPRRAAAGQTIEIERLGHQTNWQWTPTAQATINADGTFSAVWTTNHIGRFLIRAVLGGSLGQRRQRRQRPDRRDDGLPAVDRHPVRARLLRPQDRLRHAADPLDDRRRQPDAEVRQQGRHLLPRPHARRAGDRPRPVRQRRRLGSDDGHRQGARHHRHGHASAPCRCPLRRVGARARARRRAARQSARTARSRLALGVAVSRRDAEHVNALGGGGEPRLLGRLDQLVGAAPVLAEHGDADAGAQRRAAPGLAARAPRRRSGSRAPGRRGGRCRGR